MSDKHILVAFDMGVDPDKVDAIVWYLNEHLKDFTRITGPAEWVTQEPEIIGITVDGNKWESPRYDR